YFGLDPLFIDPVRDTSLRIRYDQPTDVGVDRIVNSMAAYARYGGPCIVVDLGTATTFDVVSGDGTYLGGAICPGAHLAADALFARAARLPRVELKPPASVIGASTASSIQSGLFFGYVGL